MIKLSAMNCSLNTDRNKDICIIRKVSLIAISELKGNSRHLPRLNKEEDIGFYVRP